MFKAHTAGVYTSKATRRSNWYSFSKYLAIHSTTRVPSNSKSWFDTWTRRKETKGSRRESKEWRFSYWAVLLAFAVLFLGKTPTASGQSQTRLDIKVPFLSLPDTYAALIGAKAFLGEASWTHLTEFGEDYAVWITSYERLKEGPRITVRARVEVRTPSMFTSGSLIASRNISATFRAQDDWYGVGSIAQAIRKQARNTRRSFLAEALHVGDSTYRAVCEIMGKIPRVRAQNKSGHIGDSQLPDSTPRSYEEPSSQQNGTLRVAQRKGIYLYVHLSPGQALTGRSVIIRSQTGDLVGQGVVQSIVDSEITIEITTTHGEGPRENDQVFIME